MTYTIKNKEGVVILKFDADGISNLNPCDFEMFYNTSELNGDIIIDFNVINDTIQDKIYSDGYRDGYRDGSDKSFKEGKNAGFNGGYKLGKKVGKKKGYDEGYEKGYDNGYNEAWAEEDESYFNRTGIDSSNPIDEL